jgi:hypothetical protein
MAGGHYGRTQRRFLEIPARSKSSQFEAVACFGVFLTAFETFGLVATEDEV